MNSTLSLTIRFLDPVPQFHGRGDDGEPAWPPSPLRLFQAIVGAAGIRWRETAFRDYARPALQWLEVLRPSVVTPEAIIANTGYRMYVPNNACDLMTAAWARGDANATPAKLKLLVEKDVRPTRLHSDCVHYLFPLPDGTCPHFDVLQAAARSITHLGWGVDMVAGNAEVLTDEQVAKLDGERWVPGESGTPLRVPKVGTLDDLMKKHQAFLGRLSDGGFKPVPPLREFDTVNYRRATDPERRPYAAFRITSIDPDERPPSFNTARRCRDVAAWVRHATSQVCEHWPDIASFVHGHDSAGSQLKGEHADRRFMYLPLPSIERRPNGTHVGDIRRVLIAAPSGCEEQIKWLRQRLPGEELVFEECSHGMLLPLAAKSDWVLERYVGSSRTWSSVTPVVWPGHTDRDAVKAEEILRKAFVQAGVSQTITDLEWGPFGFRRGVEPAGRFERLDKLTGQRSHVRVCFANEVRGPLAVGAGRYRGMGVFAAE